MTKWFLNRVLYLQHKLLLPVIFTILVFTPHESLALEDGQIETFEISPKLSKYIFRFAKSTNDSGIIHISREGDSKFVQGKMHAIKKEIIKIDDGVQQ